MFLQLGQQPKRRGLRQEIGGGPTIFFNGSLVGLRGDHSCAFRSLYLLPQLGNLQLKSGVGPLLSLKICAQALARLISLPSPLSHNSIRSFSISRPLLELGGLTLQPLLFLLKACDLRAEALNLRCLGGKLGQLSRELQVLGRQGPDFPLQLLNLTVPA